jgi:DUF4097 and DUF4098 domain-containing protein YvlB
MMYRFAALVAAALAIASPAFAQRVPFTRTFDVGASPALEVTTGRGKIAVRSGGQGRIVVRGTVTVRVGGDVPTDALAIAQRIAADPPIQHTGDLVALTTPTDSRERRAVTVSYEVEVPPSSRVTTTSESGESSIAAIDGPVSVQTQSATISVVRTAGETTVVTGSGAVLVDDVTGDVSVKTSSSGITARAVRGGLRVETGSGAVDVSLTGAGPVHVRTRSSGVQLRGLAGATDVETGSGRITVALSPTAALRVDLTTRSGSIDVKTVGVLGTIDKRRVVGTIGAGGPDVTLVSRSGSIRITRQPT